MQERQMWGGRKGGEKGREWNKSERKATEGNGREEKDCKARRQNFRNYITPNHF